MLRITVDEFEYAPEDGKSTYRVEVKKRQLLEIVVDPEREPLAPIMERFFPRPG